MCIERFPQTLGQRSMGTHCGYIQGRIGVYVRANGKGSSPGVAGCCPADLSDDPSAPEEVRCDSPTISDIPKNYPTFAIFGGSTFPPAFER